MKVNIVAYEDIGTWILGKFAKKLNEELNKAGIPCSIGKSPDPDADINHHIIYINYQSRATNLDTLMITHIDTLHKFHLLKRQLAFARMGICMSREQQIKLAGAGLPTDRLCYVNPAHDEIMKPRPLVLGITLKVHSDGRKEEGSLLKLCSRVSPEDFRFIIMGEGWNSIVDEIRGKGFRVDYYDAFDYHKYREIVPSFDYFLYFAHDEGSMGFMDALSAGVRTIVTPQGYHLDVPGGITHAVNNAEELAEACLKIAKERRKLARSVAAWTWPNYAKKHIDLWKFLLEKRPLSSIGDPGYLDGIASLLTPESAPHMPTMERLRYKLRLLRNSSRTFYNFFPEAGSGLIDSTRKLARRIKKRLSR